MKVEKDFEEFIGLLNKHEVKYIIVGAYAMALYAEPRNTGDIDFFIECTKINANKLLKVLKIKTLEFEHLVCEKISELDYAIFKMEQMSKFPFCVQPILIPFIKNHRLHS